MVTIKNKTDLCCIIMLLIIAGIFLFIGTYPAWAGPNSSAGCALDMDYTTRDYDPHITSQDIESAITAQADDEIWVAIVAQNVSNLDTYQTEINFDTGCLEFLKGYEDNSFGGISNLLKKNGGTTVGFNAVEKEPGTVNVANSLAGSDKNDAPEGSGIIALLQFKVLNCDSDIHLTLSNVHYVDSDSLSEEIANLMNAGPSETHQIRITAGISGSVKPSGDITVNSGEDKAFTVETGTGYVIDTFKVDHEDKTSELADNTYTLTNIQGDHVISVTFKMSDHTIIASAGQGGSILPAGNASATNGSDKTFNITPDNCYQIKDILVDGISVGNQNTYTFANIIADHTITAVFDIKTFTITAFAGDNGRISPAGNVKADCGSDKTFDIIPGQCCQIKDVLIDNVSVGKPNSYTFTNVTSEHSVKALFEIRTYTVSASAGNGGSISPYGDVPAICGSDKTFSIIPDHGYHVEDVLVDNVSVGKQNSYTFKNVESAHTIWVSFSEDKDNPPTIASPKTGQPSDITGTSFTANWHAVPDAESYYLDVSSEHGFGSYVTGYENSDVGNVTSQYVNGLTAGMTYYYRVRAVNTIGISPNSVTMPITTVPLAPGISEASEITENSFVANWNIVPGAETYHLDVSPESDFSSCVPGYKDLSLGSKTSQRIIGLNRATTYYYRVRAVNSGGASTNSVIQAVTTLPLPGDFNCDRTVDLQDVIIVLQILTGNTQSLGEICMEGDINGDGRTGMEDAVYILQMLSLKLGEISI